MCKTTGILGETRCKHAMPPGTSSLPGSADSKESSGVVVRVWLLPRCACEGGNREETRKVGLIACP